ncbi:MAG: protein kinase [Acidobacteriota bacterium]
MSAGTGVDRIGKYEVLEKIGSGGFAIVYKGYDPFIKRPVAIKVCYSRDEETRQRFFREAEIAGSLVHRNITMVYDFGVHEQMPYLVEEYLSGEDLAHMIRRHEPADLATKLRFLVEIASGLDHAHRRGVIHRDIKPGNIRVLDDGSTKIMDFGTAKLADVDSQLTKSGMTVGTVAYLSPERLLGRESGLNSDLFSYGVLGYELLTFVRPFSGRNLAQLIDAVLNHEPKPLHEVWEACPPKLSRVIHRCLAKDATTRYRDCERLLAELRDLVESLADLHLTGVFNDATQTGVVPVTGTLPNVQVSGLLERARELIAAGKTARAQVMLEEVLDLAPTNTEARVLMASCHEAAATPSTDDAVATPTYAGSDERRARKIAEATASIRSYAERERFVEAAEALEFARRLFGSIDEDRTLRRYLVEAARRCRRRLQAEADQMAQSIVDHMVLLQQTDRLDAERAERCAGLVAELSQDDLAARDLVELVRRRAAARHQEERAEQLERRRLEAVVSIEAMLARGDVDTARSALRFAVEKLGTFDAVARLEERIHELERG